MKVQSREAFMIFKRTVAGLRGQNWLAIAIELTIVIIGVFVGIQVANWNEGRLEQHETRQMLTRLKPELRNLLDLYGSARTYYATTRDYASTAFAGWGSDPRVSDREFVIAAYQASQIYATAINNATWATIFGADRLRTIEEPEVRNNLAFLMYSDTSQIDIEAVNTPYRQNVRRVIPVEIQDAIREECGDQRPENNPQLWYLPKSCDVELADADASMAAAALRDHPELISDLRWHTAAEASFLNNIDTFDKKARQLQEQIEALY